MQDKLVSIMFTGFGLTVLLGLGGLLFVLVYWIRAKVTKRQMNAKRGIASIFCFLAFALGLIGLAGSLFWLFAGIVILGKALSERPSSAFLTYFLLPAGLCLCSLLVIIVSPLLGFRFGIQSLRKKEEPKCFRYIGLLLNLLPGLVILLLLFWIIGLVVLGGLGSVMKFFGN